VLECFDYWLRRNFAYSSMPAFICWYIWNERNLTIFKSKYPSIEKIFFLSIVDVADHKILKLPKTIRRTGHILPKHRIIGWFDGASQINEDQSGAGGVIQLDEHTIYR
jgi:hypothetical protein